MNDSTRGFDLLGIGDQSLTKMPEKSPVTGTVSNRVGIGRRREYPPVVEYTTAAGPAV
jgi:hypothetical protein